MNSKSVRSIKIDEHFSLKERATFVGSLLLLAPFDKGSPQAKQ
jgi:hypothetical protein